MDEPGYFLAPYTVVNIPIGENAEDYIKKLYEEAGLDAKEYLDRRAKQKACEEEYYRNHAVCPECGSDRYSSTYMGYLMNPDCPEKYRDENHVKCAHCGWKGIWHDLVRKP